jgi:hypothetical protein
MQPPAPKVLRAYHVQLHAPTDAPNAAPNRV